MDGLLLFCPIGNIGVIAVAARDDVVARVAVEHIVALDGSLA